MSGRSDSREVMGSESQTREACVDQGSAVGIRITRDTKLLQEHTAETPHRGARRKVLHSSLNLTSV